MSGSTCVNCEFASYNFPYSATATSCSNCNAACDAGKYLINAQNEICPSYSAIPDCQSCQSCSTSEQVVWPCTTGRRISDSSKCIPAANFLDIRKTKCPANQYLDFEPVQVKSWRDTDLLSVSPTSMFFAVSNAAWYVRIYESESLENPLITPVTSQSPVMEHFTSTQPLTYNIFKSLTWSMDGNFLYVLQRDGSIMRMQVMPAGSRTIQPAWSASSAAETPCMHSASKSMCIAMPSSLKLSIGLICTIDICTTNVRTSYLVRIKNSGERLPVSLAAHSAPYPATHLMLDASNNVAYWSIYSEWLYAKASLSDGWATSSTKRKVLKVALSTDYNIGTISQILASGTLEAAALMPGSSLLLAYMPSSSSVVNLIVRDTSDLSAAVSSAAFHPNIQNFSTSAYALPSRVFFTDHGRFFVQKPLEPLMVVKYGQCMSCPAGKITSGAYSITECKCDGDFWLDASTLQCKPLNPCKSGEYILSYATAYSDYNCTRCSMCPAGKYRNLDPNDRQNACNGQGTFDLDPKNNLQCIPCGACARGSYMNLSTCNGSTSQPPLLSAFCPKCRSCPDMHNIKEETDCSGTGYNDTRQCIDCQYPCGQGADNVYMPSGVPEAGCDGLTVFSQPRTKLACKPCAATCPASEIRVSGCNGTTR